MVAGDQFFTTCLQESNRWRSAIHLSDAAADAASLDLVGLSAICCACGKDPCCSGGSLEPKGGA
jgi:hypothetical protein